MALTMILQTATHLCSVGDIPLAVKWGPAATKYERWLEREGHVYMDMQPLQVRQVAAPDRGVWVHKLQREGAAMMHSVFQLYPDMSLLCIKRL